jgi:cytochrome c biogenesis protein CcmG/thiol:disulfide interchange protein DsbE
VKRVAGLVVVLLAATAACSASSSSIGPGPSPNPSLKALVSAAHLQPCPTSSAQSVSGGLPDITVPCLGNGPAVHMAGLTGEPTVVNIWGSWCIPCQKEEPFLASAFNADKKQVRFLGIDIVDQADSALDFDAHVHPPVHYPSVFDVDRKVALALAVQGPPATFFVDAAGKIVGRARTPYTSTAELQQDIARYLHVPA